MLASQVCASEREPGAGEMETHLWAWMWISVSLGARGFLCFAEENGLEQGSPPSPQIGHSVNKTLFPLISVLCLCMVAHG